MGADMIGYVAVIPKKSGKKANAYLSRLKKLMNKKPDNSEALEKMIAALTKFGVNLRGYNNHEELETYESAKDNNLEDWSQSVISALELIKQDLSSLNKINFDKFERLGRDMMTREMKIAGKSVVILTAGDMTWGDEPQGYGYRLMKAMANTGLLDYLETAVK